MMKQIVCHVGMFDYNQKIYLADGDKITPLGQSPVFQLDNSIVELCMANGVTNVHLYGEPTYLSRLAKNINYIMYQKYSNKNHIIVEVN